MNTTNTIKPNIIRVENDDKFSYEALHQFIDAAQEAIRTRNAFYVAISGGHTPAGFYELLSKEEIYSKIDWKKVHLFLLQF